MMSANKPGAAIFSMIGINGSPFRQLVGMLQTFQALLALVLIAVTTVEASSGTGDLAAVVVAAPDPLERLLLLRPAPRSIHTSPVRFLLEVTTDLDVYKVAYAQHWACVQVDGRDSSCVPLIGSEPLRVHLPVGEHSARAFVATSAEMTPETERKHMTDIVAFTVVGQEEFGKHEQRRLELERARLGQPSDQGLMDWALAEAPKYQRAINSSQVVSVSCEQTKQSGDETSQICTADPTVSSVVAQPTMSTPTEPPFLIIGVKTSLVDGFPFRQAMRQTWASAKSLPPGVHLLFAGCRLPVPLENPSPSSHDDNGSRQKIIAALELEKRAFGDLLTDELDCDDGYLHLPNKVKQFMHYVATHERYRLAKFVMIADDDIYLRVSTLTAELRQRGELVNMYAGSSLAKPFLLPIRDAQHLHFVPNSVYPMDEFPPFTIGSHYLLSMDCVEFIAENRDELQGLGVLDDVSVALWLLAIQVHPQHIDEFRLLRTSRCREELLSFADLSPLAIRLIHKNLEQGLGLCHGLDQDLWDKTTVKKAETRVKTAANH